MTSRTRQTLTRSVVLAAVAVAGVLALAGCKLPGGNGSAPKAGAPAPAVSTPAATASPVASGKSGKPSASAKTSGRPSASTRTGLPDVCGLLTRAEVSSLAGGKQIVQIDPDGATAADATRHCQWQLSGARVAVFLTKTTRAQFDVRSPEAKSVTGVGDEAYTLAGHLFILYRGLQVDIYTSTGATEAAEVQVQKAVAAKVLPRL